MSEQSTQEVSLAKVFFGFVASFVFVFIAGYLTSNYPVVFIPIVVVAAIIVSNFCRVCPRLKGRCRLCST